MLFSLKLLIDVSKAKFYEDFRNIVFNALKFTTKSQYWLIFHKILSKKSFFTNVYFMFSLSYHNKELLFIINELGM